MSVLGGTYPVLDSVVLNTIQASHADFVLSEGTITINGLATPIPIKNIIKGGYQEIAYAAGTPKVVTLTVTGTPATNTLYKIRLKAYSAQGNQLSSAQQKYVLSKDYAYYTGASDTATTVGAGLAALISNDLEGFATATSSSGVMTITAADATADLIVTVVDPSQASVLVVTTGTAYVAPAGTFAIVNAINPTAVSGNTYQTYVFILKAEIPGKGLNSPGNEYIVGEVILFANSADSNFSALDTYIGTVVGGTATAAGYLGIS
jgi:hypothetical protein